MTDDTREQTYNFEDYKKAQDIGAALNRGREDLRSSKANSAKQKVGDFAKTGFKLINPSDDLYDNPSRENERPYNVQEQHADAYRISLLKNSAKEFENNLEKIVGGISDDKLENLLFREDSRNAILQSNDDKGRETIESFLAYDGLKKAVESYEKNGSTGIAEIDDRVKRIAANEYAKERRKALKEAGYDDEGLLDTFEEIARAAAMGGGLLKDKIKEYALKGLNKELSEAEKAYKDSKMAASDTVRKYITKKASSDDPREFQEALGLSYELNKAA